MTAHGKVVVLNGVPRSGKSSIARALQGLAPEPWIGLGVDIYADAILPQRLIPGIGLRPGGERPDLEDSVVRLYRSLYKSVAAHAGEGFNVVVDVGHHDHYACVSGILEQCAPLLAGFDVLFVGVMCPIDEIVRRREASPDDRPRLARTADGEIHPDVLCWQEAVHAGRSYDLVVDTAQFTPEECAAAVLGALDEARQEPSAFAKLAKG